jgi:phenylpyruvate tautomerase PptA (4-oxalocrotonate tautomerase family)
LTAFYNGDALNGKSTSAAVTQVVNQAKIAMSLTSAPNPSPSGKLVKFTAAFTSTGGMPKGTVTFSLAGTTLGTATIGSTGEATFSTTKLPVGSDVVTATYAGTADYSAAMASVTQVVNATTTVLTSSLNPSNYGQAVTLSAQVATTGSTPPTGTVTFKNGTTGLGTVSVNASGVATLTVTNLPVGSDSLAAFYNGDALNAKSTSAEVTQVVSQAAITMALTSTPNPSLSGNAVKFTATFTSTGGLPKGTVTFGLAETTLGTVTIDRGEATLSTKELPAGSDVVTATYAGDADYSAAMASVTQVVNATTTVLTSSVNPSNYDEAVSAQVATTGSTTATGP